MGINHHGQSIIFKFELISNEDAHTFEWFFGLWLKFMNDKPTNVIITDQDKPMQIAISKVFPMSRHHFLLVAHNEKSL